MKMSKWTQYSMSAKHQYQWAGVIEWNIPANKLLLAGTVPANKFLLAGTPD